MVTINKRRRKNVPDKRLNGRVAVVTGAHTAIGSAIVNRFANEGAKVAFFGCCEESGGRLLDTIKSSNGECLFAKVNISNHDEVKTFFDKVSETLGDADTLVTVPTITQCKPFVELSEDDWVDLMENDGLGAIYAMWEALPAMKMHRKGSIINVTSLYGSEAGVRVAFNAYFMAGMHNLMRCLSMEYSPWGIRVNALAPGFIAEDGQEHTSEDVFRVMGDDTLRRAGTPEEVANAALWLASDEASFVTGAVINVNGGVVSRTIETKTWMTGDTEFPRSFETGASAVKDAAQR